VKQNGRGNESDPPVMTPRFRIRCADPRRHSGVSTRTRLKFAHSITRINNGKAAPVHPLQLPIAIAIEAIVPMKIFFVRDYVEFIARSTRRKYAGRRCLKS
jgi:hypothetical protein